MHEFWEDFIDDLGTAWINSWIKVREAKRLTEEWRCRACCRTHKPFTPWERKIRMGGKVIRREKMEENTYTTLEQNHKRNGYVSVTTPSLLPLSSLFSFSQSIFQRLQHNASASGDSSNTLLWPKYNSVVWWLAKSRRWGGGVVQHTSSTTFKIQTFI